MLFWYERKGELEKKSKPQMGFEPTTLRDLVGCSNRWATAGSMASKGHISGSRLETENWKELK